MSRWFARPTGTLLILRKRPRLASWNKRTDPDQVRLLEYLEDTEDLLASSRVADPWTLLLDVGLSEDRDLLDMPDLDNFAYPLASRLHDQSLVSVWCVKRHARVSHTAIARAEEVAAPAPTYRARTTASFETRAFKEQVRAALATTDEIPPGPVALQISFSVSRRRNWLNLWKPTIDALDPLLGRTRVDRDWHPRDGRITELGLHLTIDDSLGYDVVIEIAAAPSR